MEGASWTNNLSWVEGYANVLGPMNQLSAQFHMHCLTRLSRQQNPSVTCTRGLSGSPYSTFCLLETSCFRYWGQGAWTGYAQEIHRRGEEAAGSEERQRLPSAKNKKLRDALQSVTFV